MMVKIVFVVLVLILNPGERLRNQGETGVRGEIVDRRPEISHRGVAAENLGTTADIETV
jgi:hypothetical protein